MGTRRQQATGSSVVALRLPTPGQDLPGRHGAFGPRVHPQRPAAAGLLLPRNQGRRSPRSPGPELLLANAGSRLRALGRLCR